jgi:hypothetical protein
MPSHHSRSVHQLHLRGLASQPVLHQGRTLVSDAAPRQLRRWGAIQHPEAASEEPTARPIQLRLPATLCMGIGAPRLPTRLSLCPSYCVPPPVRPPPAPVPAVAIVKGSTSNGRLCDRKTESVAQCRVACRAGLILCIHEPKPARAQPPPRCPFPRLYHRVHTPRAGSSTGLPPTPLGRHLHETCKCRMAISPRMC